jgi:signal transduction histidine kinase/CheY-like chemotaxis protein
VIKPLFNRLRAKLASKKGTIKAILYTFLVFILSGFIYLTYDEYKKAIVVQQQQQMLGISKSIARSIELFTNDISDSIKVITLDKDFINSLSYIEDGKMLDSYNDKINAYYEAEKETIDSIYFFSENGKFITQYPQSFKEIDYIFKADVDTAIASKKTHIGKAYFDKTRNMFIFNIYEPVFDGNNFKGVVSVAISLDVIYDKLIAPVKIGEKGYALVKDQQGIIIMHQLKEQIGIDVIETRKQLHPNLDFEDLEDLIEHQLKAEEGTAIYYSYWWAESDLKRAKKLNAYTPVKFGEYFWVVAVTMSYDEIQGPINRFLGIIIGIVIIIIIIINFFIVELLKVKKNKEELEKETEYLRVLNEASEQLRKKEAELYHSHKLKMIGTLAGGIAHDINNLLTPILGYSELLLMRTEEDSDYYEDVEEILKASKKGKDLIEQILLFSRNDKEAVKSELVNMSEVTRETIKLLKAVIPRDVIIKENIKEDCGYIKANFTQVHQVIFNLCTNAYQSIKDNKGTVEISLNTIGGTEAKHINNLLSEKRNYIELVVKDTGCGMDEETKERIFDPFFTTKEIGKGTGLGLFVVQNIVDKFEGIITVESEINKGSCFMVYLPLVNKEVTIGKDENSKYILKDKKAILLVDDSKENIKVIKKSLEHLGFQVVTETDGVKAIKLFKKDCKRFDVVITDYMMPNIKGSELAAEIKKIKKDTAIILMSGYIDKCNINNNEHVDAYISKPIEISELLEAIKRTI